MDEVTQQNAALVEEAAAASQSMQEQAANLATVVGFFKTGAQGVAAAAIPRRAAPTAPPSPRVAKARARAVARPAAKPAQRLAPAKVTESDWEEF
jgi:methyl-accepting chemotaxis protein